MRWLILILVMVAQDLSASHLSATAVSGSRGHASGGDTPRLPVANASLQEERPSQVPVLLYHHLESRPSGENGAIIGVGEFEAQMAWLRKRGYTAITTDELWRWLADEDYLPSKPVLITFDDGYRSNYEHAFPVLQRNGMRAAIFVVSGLAGRSEGDLEYLPWKEMREMERSGLVEIQAHSHDGHRHIGGRPALTTWSTADVKADLKELRGRFEEGGLRPPTAFAYPYGAYSETTLSALPSDGMRVAFTVREGYVRQTDSPLELPRLVIYPGISLCRFGEIVTGLPAGTCGN